MKSLENFKLFQFRVNFNSESLKEKRKKSVKKSLKKPFVSH